MPSPLQARRCSILFFVFFLLASGDIVKRKLVKLAGPSFEKKKITVQILNEIDAQIEKFLLLRIVTSVIVGVATWLAFRWLGVNHPALWGVAAGIFNSVPYFGPVIVAGATAIAAFLQFGDHRDGALRVRRVHRDYKRRRLAADTLAVEPGGAHQRGRDVHRPHLLELRLGNLGNAAGRAADARRREGVLRPDRRPQTHRRTPGRVGAALRSVLRQPDDFFQRRLAFHDAREAFVTQRHHARASGRFRQPALGCALQDQVPQLPFIAISSVDRDAAL